MSEGIGDRLKAARELAGDLSARELGALAGVAETYPTLIESGARKQIGGEIVASLAEVLGTTTDQLLLGKGPQPTERQVKKAVAAARERRRVEVAS